MVFLGSVSIVLSVFFLALVHGAQNPQYTITSFQFEKPKEIVLPQTQFTTQQNTHFYTYGTQSGYGNNPNPNQFSYQPQVQQSYQQPQRQQQPQQMQQRWQQLQPIASNQRNYNRPQQQQQNAGNGVTVELANHDGYLDLPFDLLSDPQKLFAYLNQMEKQQQQTPSATTIQQQQMHNVRQQTQPPNLNPQPFQQNNFQRFGGNSIPNQTPKPQNVLPPTFQTPKDTAQIPNDLFRPLFVGDDEGVKEATTPAPCELCCNVGESPCTACCDNTPFLSAAALKSSAG